MDCRRSTESLAAPPARLAISDETPSATRAGGCGCDRGHGRSDVGDPQAGVGLVAAVDRDQHSGHRLERRREVQRPGVDAAHAGDRPGSAITKSLSSRESPATRTSVSTGPSPSSSSLALMWWNAATTRDSRQQRRGLLSGAALGYGDPPRAALAEGERVDAVDDQRPGERLGQLMQQLRRGPPTARRRRRCPPPAAASALRQGDTPARPVRGLLRALRRTGPEQHRQPGQAEPAGEAPALLTRTPEDADGEPGQGGAWGWSVPGAEVMTRSCHRRAERRGSAGSGRRSAWTRRA